MKLIDVLQVIPEAPIYIKTFELESFFYANPAESIRILEELGLIRDVNGWQRTKFGSAFVGHPYMLLSYQYEFNQGILDKAEATAKDILSDIEMLLRPGEELICHFNEEWVWMVKILDTNLSIDDYLALREKENDLK